MLFFLGGWFWGRAVCFSFLDYIHSFAGFIIQFLPYSHMSSSACMLLSLSMCFGISLMHSFFQCANFLLYTTGQYQCNGLSTIHSDNGGSVVQICNRLTSNHTTQSFKAAPIFNINPQEHRGRADKQRRVKCTWKNSEDMRRSSKSSPIDPV